MNTSSSSSLLFFQQAAVLNNDGIDTIVNGQDVTFALTSMTKALKLMKLALAATLEQSTISTTTSTSNNSNSHNVSHEQHHQMNGYEDTSSSLPLSSPFVSTAAAVFPIGIEVPSMESSDTIVFNQLLQVPIPHSKLTDMNKNMTSTTTMQLSAYEINIYTCAVIFNLALIHQYLGSSRKESMVKAENLYGMVLRLLDACSNLHDSSSNKKRPLYCATSSTFVFSSSYTAMRTALLTRLGSMNNLSQIRCHRADERGVCASSFSSGSTGGDSRDNRCSYQEQQGREQQHDHLVHQHNHGFGSSSRTNTSTSAAERWGDGGFAGLKRFFTGLQQEISLAVREARPSSSGFLFSGGNGLEDNYYEDRVVGGTWGEQQQQQGILEAEEDDITVMHIMSQMFDEPAVHGLLLLNVLMRDSPCSVASAA